MIPAAQLVLAALDAEIAELEEVRDSALVRWAASTNDPDTEAVIAKTIADIDEEIERLAVRRTAVVAEVSGRPRLRLVK